MWPHVPGAEAPLINPKDNGAFFFHDCCSTWAKPVVHNGIAPIPMMTDAMINNG